jgi:hypothetical protein
VKAPRSAIWIGSIAVLTAGCGGALNRTASNMLTRPTQVAQMKLTPYQLSHTYAVTYLDAGKALTAHPGDVFVVAFTTPPPGSKIPYYGAPHSSDPDVLAPLPIPGCPSDADITQLLSQAGVSTAHSAKLLPTLRCQPSPEIIIASAFKAVSPGTASIDASGSEASGGARFRLTVSVTLP